MENPRQEREPELEYQLPISKWRVCDQPRDKLLKVGPDNMSDPELLGLVFGSGSRTRTGTVSAIDLGRALLRRFGSLRELSVRDVREYARISGVGPAKAAQLAAVMEIARRLESARGADLTQVCAPEDVASIYGPLMRGLKNEIFRIILLNTANLVIGDRTISEGGLAASIVEPRAVFRQAVLENAAAIICLHNHPSGNPEPSPEDIRVTKQLVSAGKLMGVPVHDHIIIAGNNFTSLAERGYVV